MSPVARLLALLVRGYQVLLSPLLPPRCRFAPSCSAYALQALQAHGAGRGGWLAVRRVARCHPFHAGGHDPVPAAAPPRGLAPACSPGQAVDVCVGDDGVRSSFAPRRPAPGLGALP